MHIYRQYLLIAFSMILLIGCTPASLDHPYSESITERRAELKDELLALLPKEDRGKHIAQQEAIWLADTAYAAAAAISRINDSNFPGWSGNNFVNMNWQDRGLCWQYQHDMYRELRRRKLAFFRVGACVRDQGDMSEHNCVYIAAKSGSWPLAWVLDAWMWNGRLKVDAAWEMDADRWEDIPEVLDRIAPVYTEEHRYPVEHWYRIKTFRGEYAPFWSDDARRSEQYARMYQNILDGEKARCGKLTNY